MGVEGEGYQPSEEEIKKAEEMMTPEQKEASELREKLSETEKEISRSQEEKKAEEMMTFSQAELSRQRENLVELRNMGPERYEAMEKEVANQLSESLQEWADSEKKRIQDIYDQYADALDKEEVSSYGSEGKIFRYNKIFDRLKTYYDMLKFHNESKTVFVNTVSAKFFPLVGGDRYELAINADDWERFADQLPPELKKKYELVHTKQLLDSQIKAYEQLKKSEIDLEHPSIFAEEESKKSSDIK